MQRPVYPFRATKKIFRRAMLPEQAGAVGFWAGFDYLFMAGYVIFFTVCCTWAAGYFRPGSLWHGVGVALAWLALGRGGEALQS